MSADRASRPHSAPPQSSGAICPGCGLAVDPLRAGHVAILGGRFVYYCDASCKQAHSALRAPLSTLSPDEIVTAEPPPVLVVDSGPRSIRGVPMPEPSSQMRPRLAAVLPEREVTPAPPAPEPELAPRTLRSPPRASGVEVKAPPIAVDLPAPPPPLRAMAESATTLRVDGPYRVPSAVVVVVSALGIAAGLLAPSVGLLGAAASAARLPLAWFAACAALARVVLVRRDLAAVHPAVRMAPVLGLAAAATWARLTGDALGGTLAVLAGLAGAALIGTDLLVYYARAGVARARERIARELDVQVRVLHGGETVMVRASEVKPGEQIVLEAGDVAGVDAVVTAGEALVAPWLDAPVDVPKREGDAIVAGARVKEGRLSALTTWAGRERAFSKLSLSSTMRVDVVAPLARGTRLAVERGAPIVAGLLAACAVANGGRPAYVLAAACAGALCASVTALAELVALLHARAQAAALESGIVYRDAASFGRAGEVDLAVLCARGTVLLGEPEIVSIEPVAREGAATDDEIGRLLSLAAGAEQVSSHPFASAILRAARARGVRPDNVRNATAQAGLGVTALAASGERLVVGSRALMMKERISVALAEARLNELEAQGRSALLVAIAEKLVGVLALQDGLRAGARAAVQRLIDARVEPVLLSGEARETCDTIGQALDIDHIRPEVLPADRGAEVRALGEGGHVIAAIGHPSADDAALGAADVSVAMASAGGTPGESSIALASDDVRDASAAITLARRTRDRARAAIAISAVPTVLALVALALGFVPLVVAPIIAMGLAMGLSLFAGRDLTSSRP